MRILLPLLIVFRAFGQDVNYQALRDGSPTEALRTENVELKRDVGTITLKNGQLAFIKVMQDRPAIAIFTGEGVFRMKPAISIEARHLALITGRPDVEEAFESAVFFFTDGTYNEVKSQAAAMPIDPRAAGLLKNLRDKLRRDMTLGDIGNVEAELTAELYDPQRGASFRAYLHGKHFPDLRFFMVPSGALPSIQSPEETALVNIETGDHAGILYLSHLESEWAKGTATSNEDKREIGALHYKIDTVVAKGTSLSGSTEMQFSAVRAGARVLRIDLLPSLRVQRVTDERQRVIPFVQESAKADDSFHVFLPEPLEAGKKYMLRFEYEGGKVIRDEGGGNFSVVARSSWYPNVNSFLDHATFDLTFHSPKQFTLVSVGKKVGETKDGNTLVSQWKSDLPIAVAGFNYGLFKEKSVTDEQANYKVEVYTTQEVPDNLKPFEEAVSLTPSAMATNAMADTQNSVRLYQQIFGDSPFGRVAITQQPAFFFGQSWPTLVYLPVSAFLDSTQRWHMMGPMAFKFANFVDEVTPHEVAHQWFGHLVGWSSYHDQWLSEGFAEFSAGYFLEKTRSVADGQKFWDRLQTEITEKNSYGVSANDAGPIWLGLRLNTSRTSGAYNRLVYPKGACILQMIRMLMFDDKTGDQDFSDMMKDYLKTYLFKNASSEDFIQVVTRHMKPTMDLDGSHNLGWFTREWVYGTDLPKYHLEYSLKPAPDGKLRFTGKLTQSGVSPDFLMRVPIYLDFDGRLIRLGSTAMRGNMTTPKMSVLLPRKPKRVLLSAHHDVLASETTVKEIPD